MDLFGLGESTISRRRAIRPSFTITLGIRAQIYRYLRRFKLKLNRKGPRLKARMRNMDDDGNRLVNLHRRQSELFVMARARRDGQALGTWLLSDLERKLFGEDE